MAASRDRGSSLREILDEEDTAALGETKPHSRTHSHLEHKDTVRQPNRQPRRSRRPINHVATHFLRAALLIGHPGVACSGQSPGQRAVHGRRCASRTPPRTAPASRLTVRRFGLGLARAPQDEEDSIFGSRAAAKVASKPAPAGDGGGVKVTGGGFSAALDDDSDDHPATAFPTAQTAHRFSHGMTVR